MTYQRYDNLEVYKLSYKLALEIHRLSLTLPKMNISCSPTKCGVPVAQFFPIWLKGWGDVQALLMSVTIWLWPWGRLKKLGLG
jgi:hypothetical protein